MTHDLWRPFCWFSARNIELEVDMSVVVIWQHLCVVLAEEVEPIMGRSGGSIPGFSNPHVDVCLVKIFSPKLLLVTMPVTFSHRQGDEPIELHTVWSAYRWSWFSASTAKPHKKTHTHTHTGAHTEISIASNSRLDAVRKSATQKKKLIWMWRSKPREQTQLHNK